MKRPIYILHFVALLLAVVLTLNLCSCRNGHRFHDARTKILVIWPYAEDDQVFATWKKVLKDSLNQKFNDYSVTHLHLDYFEKTANEQARWQQVDSLYRSMERDGMKPDVVLLYGDMVMNSVFDHTQLSQSDIPFVFFGSHLPRLPQNSARRQRTTGYYDTIELVKNLDFISDVTGKKTVVSQLDWSYLPMDSMYRSYLDDEMSMADTARYMNLIKIDVDIDHFKAAKEKGKIMYMVLNVLNPWKNWTDIENGTGFSVDFNFSGGNSANSIMHVKYDPYCSCNVSSADFKYMYFTTCAEHMSANDSCAGGYLTPFENMAGDAARSAAKIAVYDTSPEMLPIQPHTGKGYYVKWPVLRNHGMEYDALPPTVQLYHFNRLQKHPTLARLLTIGMAVIGVCLLVALILFAAFRIRTYRRKRKEQRREAEKAIEDYELANIILLHSDVSIVTMVGSEVRITNSLLPASKGKSYSTTADELGEIVQPFFRKDFINILNEQKAGTYSLEFQLGYGNGMTHWHRLDWTVYYNDAEPTKVGTFVNIDAQKQKEGEMIDMHRRIINSRERDNFIHEMTHQIRTPLNSIVGFSQVLALMDDLSEAEVMEYGGYIKSANVQILTLIEDMLTLAHLRNSTLQMQFTSISLKDFVTETAEAHRSAIEESGQTLKIKHPQEDVTIVSDRRVLKMIMDHLISNAKKFNKSTGAIIVDWKTEDGRVLINVTDNGIGIDKDQQELVFRRFYKVDPFTQGSGLGLALASSLAQNLKGSISIDSTLGMGSIFTLDFEQRNA